MTRARLAGLHAARAQSPKSAVKPLEIAGRYNRELTVPVVLLPIDFSEPEAKPNRGIDRVTIKVAVRQTAIDLREHKSGVGIKFLSKLPINDEGNSVERHVAGRRRGRGGAVDGCAEGRLVVMIVGANHIQIVGNGVFHSGPGHME
jgi:hypothetical protein